MVSDSYFSSKYFSYWAKNKPVHNFVEDTFLTMKECYRIYVISEIRQEWYYTTIQMPADKTHQETNHSNIKWTSQREKLKWTVKWIYIWYRFVSCATSFCDVTMKIKVKMLKLGELHALYSMYWVDNKLYLGEKVELNPLRTFVFIARIPETILCTPYQTSRK